MSQLTAEQHKQHPFIHGLRNPPEDRIKELKKMRQWMESQPHLPYVSDEYIYLFLHACFYHIENTKHAMETYFTIRANSPSIFANKDVRNEKLFASTKVAYTAKLPKLTDEGYRVLMYVVKDMDPGQFQFAEAVKGFCMYNDCILSEESLVNGYVVVFDMKYVKLGHLARVSLPVLRAFMSYIQEAHPARLKGVHIVNTASFINHVMRLITPLIRSELINLLKFHKEKVPDCLPLEIFPKEYGGDAPPLEELSLEIYTLIEKYEVWFRESECFVADETKRIKKSWWSMFSTNNNQNSANSSDTNNLNTINQEGDAFRNLTLD